MTKNIGVLAIGVVSILATAAVTQSAQAADSCSVAVSAAAQSLKGTTGVPAYAVTKQGQPIVWYVNAKISAAAKACAAGRDAEAMATLQTIASLLPAGTVNSDTAIANR